MMRALITSMLVCGAVLLALRAAAADNDDPRQAMRALAESLKLQPADFIKQFDKNKDGVLTKDEFPTPLARAHERADSNRDGKVDRNEAEELLRILRQQFAANPPPAPGGADGGRLVQFLLERMDADKDGKISKSEAKDRLAEAFDRVDANKDGALDKDELRRFAAVQARPGGPLGRNEPPDFDALDRNADGRLTREELKDTAFGKDFDRIDDDKDGRIKRKEFQEHLRKLTEKP